MILSRLGTFFFRQQMSAFTRLPTITHSSFIYLYNFSKPKVVIIGHSYFMLIMLCQIHLQSWFGGFMIWNYSVELIPIWGIPTLNYLGEEKVFRRYIFQHVQKNSNNALSWRVYLSCRKRTQSSFQAWQVHFPTDSTFSHSAFIFRYNELRLHLWMNHHVHKK